MPRWKQMICILLIVYAVLIYIFPSLRPITPVFVVEQSMEPTITSGDTVWMSQIMVSTPKVGDIVVAKIDGEFWVKRIAYLSTDGRNVIYTITGDNKQFSASARVTRQQIIGKVIFGTRRVEDEK